MSWLIKLLAPWKSELFAIVGVLAVAGIGTAAIATVHIGRLKEERATLLKANSQWAENWKVAMANRALQQQAMLDLQTSIASISKDNDAMATSIKELEANSAEIKEYMSRPIPLELRRLLNGN